MFKKLVQLLLCLVFVSTTTVMITFSFASPNVEGIQVYQKNLHLTPEHKQKLADDISRYRNADNLWDVLRDEFALRHYEDNPAVQAKIEWFMNNQDYLLRSASRAAPYLYYILQQAKKRHLPAEVVLLPIVESGYNPFSLSTVGAAGIWQLMPGTASGLGVRHDSSYDGRRDVIASTRAALNYLAYLQSFFEGNWLLAIAAYNTGEGNVLSAIKRNIRDGKDTDFWSLPVAQETRDYVPSLLALAAIISHPDQYPIYFPPVRNAPYLAQVDVGTQINLKYAANIAGISFKKIQQLNPGYKHLSTSTKGAYKLILPIENVVQFTENLASSPLSKRQINWTHYKIKPGDSLASISRKFSTSIVALRKLNRLSNNNLRQGADLLVPQSAKNINSDDEIDVADEDDNTKSSNALLASKDNNSALSKATNYTLQPGDTIYMVRSNDTLKSVATHFHISTKALLAANNIPSQKIKSGKQLVIPTHELSDTLLKEANAFKSTSKVIKPGDTLYMVRRGDTIEKIAGKFRTTPSAIRLTNLIDNNSLNEGEQLIIPTHIRG